MKADITTDGRRVQVVAAIDDLEHGPREASGTGVARLKPDDHYVESVGVGIALGRALIDLGAKIESHYLDLSITEEQAEANR